MSVIVRFTQSGTDEVFEVMAADAVFDFDCLESPTDDFTIASVLDGKEGRHEFWPWNDPKNRRFDTVTFVAGETLEEALAARSAP